MPGPISPGSSAGLRKDEIPDCPFCSTSMKPERIGADLYICPVCSRQFRPKG